MMIMCDNLFISPWFMRKKGNKMAKAKESIYELQGLSSANCASKFEKNDQNIPAVEKAQVNFADAKVTIQGDVTIKQLEQAGAFHHIKGRSENDDQYQDKQKQK